MIVVFDAKCLLCIAWVRFILKHDQRQAVRFVSMQGVTGQRLLWDAGLDVDNLSTLLVLDNHGRSFQHTAAVLRVLHALGWPWRLAWAGWFVPALLCDAAYRWVARRRYQLFGRTDVCMLPSAWALRVAGRRAAPAAPRPRVPRARCPARCAVA